MFKLIVLSVFIASAFGLRNENELPFSSRIVGGQNATIEEYPYQVSVLYKDEHICGGAILNSRKIVTSALCLEGKEDIFLKVRAGSSIINAGGVVVRVIKVYKHPYFNKTTYDYDIAILELLPVLTFSETIQPIEVDTIIPVGSFGAITGWGILEENGSASEHLQVAKLKIQGHGLCAQLLGIHNEVTDRMFCAGYENSTRDACDLDFGGPFVKEGKLLGILSWGIGCGDPYYFLNAFSSAPDLYVFISAHL